MISVSRDSRPFLYVGVPLSIKLTSLRMRVAIPLACLKSGSRVGLETLYPEKDMFRMFFSAPHSCKMITCGFSLHDRTNCVRLAFFLLNELQFHCHILKTCGALSMVLFWHVPVYVDLTYWSWWLGGCGKRKLGSRVRRGHCSLGFGLSDWSF